MTKTLAKYSQSPLLGFAARKLLRLLGVAIPKGVTIGEDFELMHGGIGTVINPLTKIGNKVRIFQGVTLGRADVYRHHTKSKFEGIHIDDGAWICAGAIVLGKTGVLRIGKNAIVGANSVVVCSIGDGEIWAGNPAVFIRNRRAEDY